ncbi:hypothetical protein VP01_4653g1 [Puccinia sorghi]|uniref:Uncharacterized protein n=1 Tax=Puccinia sorghi TaxID=27349 RepID=A0A0L6UP25_9BASI|nr:hypothetical protein VP01_4653g1 [Puccinia sorghi]
MHQQSYQHKKVLKAASTTALIMMFNSEHKIDPDLELLLLCPLALRTWTFCNPSFDPVSHTLPSLATYYLSALGTLSLAASKPCWTQPHHPTSTLPSTLFSHPNFASRLSNPVSSLSPPKLPQDPPREPQYLKVLQHSDTRNVSKRKNMARWSHKGQKPSQPSQNLLKLSEFSHYQQHLSSNLGCIGPEAQREIKNAHSGDFSILFGVIMYLNCALKYYLRPISIIWVYNCIVWVNNFCQKPNSKKRQIFLWGCCEHRNEYMLCTVAVDCTKASYTELKFISCRKRGLDLQVFINDFMLSPHIDINLHIYWIPQVLILMTEKMLNPVIGSQGMIMANFSSVFHQNIWVKNLLMIGPGVKNWTQKYMLFPKIIVSHPGFQISLSTHLKTLLIHLMALERKFRIFILKKNSEEIKILDSVFQLANIQRQDAIVTRNNKLLFLNKNNKISNKNCVARNNYFNKIIKHIRMSQGWYITKACEIPFETKFKYLNSCF